MAEIVSHPSFVGAVLPSGKALVLLQNPDLLKKQEMCLIRSLNRQGVAGSENKIRARQLPLITSVCKATTKIYLNPSSIPKREFSSWWAGGPQLD